MDALNRPSRRTALTYDEETGGFLVTGFGLFPYTLSK
jgi:hypothetical protein